MKAQIIKTITPQKRIKTQEYRVTESPSYVGMSNDNNYEDQKMLFQQEQSANKVFNDQLDSLKNLQASLKNHDRFYDYAKDFQNVINLTQAEVNVQYKQFITKEYQQRCRNIKFDEWVDKELENQIQPINDLIALQEIIKLQFPHERIPQHTVFRSTIPKYIKVKQRDWNYQIIHDITEKKKEIKLDQNNNEFQSIDTIYINKDVYDQQVLQSEINKVLKALGDRYYMYNQIFSKYCNESCGSSPQITNQFDLRDHIIKKHSKWPCHICSLEFSNKSYMLNHKTQNQCEGLASCQSCGEFFKTRIQFRQHMLTMNNTECEIKCSVEGCELKFCDKIELEHHFNANHHPSQQQNSQYILSTQIQVKDLENSDIHEYLCQKGIMSEDINDLELLKIYIRNSPTPFLIILSDNKVIYKLDFSIVAQKYQRCIFVNITDNRIDQAQLLAISLQVLPYKLRNQRITDIICATPACLEDIFSTISFFKLDSNTIWNQKLNELFTIKGKILFSRKTPNTLQSMVPKLQYPNIPLNHARAIVVSNIMKIWRSSGLLEILQTYLKQLQSKTSRKSLIQAQESDQAKTPNSVWQLIYNKIELLPDQFWDPCQFAPDWKYNTHFDAIKQPWQGDFVYCNPPFTQGVDFMIKSIEEFLLGRNVVLMLPQRSFNTRFAWRYIRKVADIINIGQVQFDPFTSPLQEPISLAFLLQPDFLSFHLKQSRARNNKGPKDETAKPELMKSKLTFFEHKQSVAKYMLQCKSPITRIIEVTKLSHDEVNKVKMSLTYSKNKSLKIIKE